MRDRVGEEFEGSVSAVTSFGIFVALMILRGGLVHIPSSGRLFHFDATVTNWSGTAPGSSFRLADRESQDRPGRSRDEPDRLCRGRIRERARHVHFRAPARKATASHGGDEADPRRFGFTRCSRGSEPMRRR